MQRFENTDVKSLENAISAIGDDWMLITVRDNENNRVNAMTASWGALGVLWNRPVCICFVRPERHTFKLLEENKTLSIAFLDKSRRDAYAVCGKESDADLVPRSLTGSTLFPRLKPRLPARCFMRTI